MGLEGVRGLMVMGFEGVRGFMVMGFEGVRGLMVMGFEGVRSTEEDLLEGALLQEVPLDARERLVRVVVRLFHPTTHHASGCRLEGSRCRVWGCEPRSVR
jgi:hypothetical protein